MISNFILQIFTLPCLVNICFVVTISRFVKKTTRNTQLLKLNIKVVNGLSTCSSLINLSSISLNHTFCVKIGSYTWFQIAAVVWFLALTLSKTKILCRHLRILFHFSLIFGKLVIPSIILFTNLLNKIVLNFKVFEWLAFLSFVKYRCYFMY